MDASVDFLLQNLKELVEYHVKLISGARNDLDQLNNDLDSLRAILKDASRKLTKDEAFKVWEKQIRVVVYDVEDTIDTCITQIAAEKAKRANFFRKMLPKKSHVDLAKEVRALRIDKVQPLFAKVEFANQSIADVPDNTVAETREIRQKKKQNIVGFEDEANTIIEFLSKESNKLESITIVGMPGLGKTTLAWKIHEDQRIKYEFPVTIWVNVSDDLNMKNVLLTILRKFTPTVPDISMEELIKLVKSYLEGVKFLIVMDDIWTSRAWSDIKDCLPMNNKWGRILITSRNVEVATHSNPKKGPHNLRFLNPDESWELLQYEVYDTLNTVPDELKKVGWSIAQNCDGLPLSIVVIGGILKDKMSLAHGFISVLKKEWNEISKSVRTYLVLEDKSKLLEKIISLSYTKLPYELRSCFLYLGMFPEDADIPVKKLIRLWIAEGFIQETPGKSLEQIAHGNLTDFINRNLLMVKEEKPNGEAKICHVHDTIREFCKTEAAVNNLNLFEEINRSGRGVFEPSEDRLAQCRRLCIHSYVLDFFLENKQAIPKVRSFLCFHKYDINLELSQMSLFTDGFALLRVYDAETIKFPKLPKIFQFIHLRYLTLVVANDQWKSLPPAISELWNLQTLILDITSPTIEIQGDIWMLRQLRHLKTKASIILTNQDGKGEGGKNLQTLSRLSPDSCTTRVFAKARNLITLGIQGNLSSQLMESRCFERLVCLNKLTLAHRVPHGVSENTMPYLPADHNRFPPNLKVLVLISTYLEWDNLSVLGRLKHLEELKLKENACKGNTWEVDGGFKHLELLRIERVPDLEYWSVTGNAFPELRFLLINNCEKLLEVPTALGKKLELLRMERVTPKAVSCAQEIGKEKEARADGGVFKLDIAPADTRRS